MKTPSIILLEGTDVSHGVQAALHKIGHVGFHNPHTSLNVEGEVLFVGLVHPIDKILLDKLPELKVVVTVTTGLQHIDLALCEQRGIEVLSLRNVSEKILRVTSTTEHTLGLVFALLRGIVHAHSSVVTENRWQRLDFVGRQISSLTVGILGMGRIGTGVASCLTVLGSEIIWFDPEVGDELGLGHRVETMDDLLKRSDVVLVHVSAGVEPRLIDSGSLEKMKPGSYLVNTSRGHIVDEKALAQAVRTGKLAGCAVDVLDGEHSSEWVPSDSPLVELARDGYNVLVTPHLGGCTSEAMDQTGLLMVDVLQNWWQSRVPK